MSLIINAIISTIKTLVIETPNAIKGMVKRIGEFLETDGAHDRRVRELNRRELKCERHAQRGERRHGAPKGRGLHPNQWRALEAAELKAARMGAAMAMADADPLGITADKAFWAVAE